MIENDIALILLDILNHDMHRYPLDILKKYTESKKEFISKELWIIKFLKCLDL